MALGSLRDLDRHVDGDPWHPAWAVSLYSPVDDVHGALLDLIGSATRSLSIGMFGFDDPELAAVIGGKLQDPRVRVELTLDKTQAAGAHERALLAVEDYPASSIAVGRSEKGAIMHLKEVVIDGLDVVSGSTNWSSSGESKQDNVLWVLRSRTLADRSAKRLAAIHAHILAGVK